MPATGTAPPLRVHTLPMDKHNLNTLPTQVVQTTGFLHHFLGGYDPPELHLVQVRSEPSLGRGNGAAGWVMFGGNHLPETLTGPADGAGFEVREWAFREDYPHPEATVVARQLAQQAFSQTTWPASVEDVWLGRALSEAYAWFYVQAACGTGDLETRRWGVEERVSQWHDREPWWSLTQAADARNCGHHVQDWSGPYVLGWSLRHRIGDDAFFRATQVLVARQVGQPMTTDQAQAASEAVSGIELDAFFEGSVHQGHLAPSLALWPAGGPGPDHRWGDRPGHLGGPDRWRGRLHPDPEGPGGRGRNRLEPGAARLVEVTVARCGPCQDAP